MLELERTNARPAAPQGEWNFATTSLTPISYPPSAPWSGHGVREARDHKKKGFRMRSVLPLGDTCTSTMCVLHQVSRKSLSVTELSLCSAYVGLGKSCSSRTFNEARRVHVGWGWGGLPVEIQGTVWELHPLKNPSDSREKGKITGRTLGGSKGVGGRTQSPL